MPDLNLIDEGGFEEAPEAPEAPVAPPAKKSVKKSSGGSGKIILLLVVFLCIAAAGVYFLNQRGIIKIWGKKHQPIAQVQEEPFPQESTAQPAETQKQADTNEVALLDTAPIQEKAEAGKQSESVKEPEAKATEPTAKKSKALKKSEAVIETESSSKLSEMKGEFTIQVIAYREKSRADETAKNLEFSGYPSFVERIPMKGGDWYTVRIGRYSSRDEAKKAVLSFAEQLQTHYVIDKVRLK
ncbi:MAG: SPOR domain-containing protein [Bacteroidota bacterium]